MRNDPIFAELNAQDLNQRFRDTIIFYDGEFRSCLGFGPGRPTTISIGFPDNSGFQSEKFDPTKLMVGRMRSSWIGVTLPDKVEGQTYFAAYFSYKAARQWHRGWNDQNCSFHIPMFMNLGPTVELLTGLVKFQLKKMPAAHHLVLSTVKQVGVAILSREIAVMRELQMKYGRKKEVKEPAYMIYYRTTPVAKLTETGIDYIHPEFKQEIEEVVIV